MTDTKVILITGAGSGFGRAFATRFAKDGHDLVLNDINSEPLKETESMLAKYERRILLQPGDIVNSSFVESMIENSVKEFGHLNVIINNAGIGEPVVELHKITEEEMQRIMDVNFKGSWLVSKFAAKKMLKQRQFTPIRGRIINVASVAGKVPAPMIGTYCCSKAAVIMMTKVLAVELAPKITVNAICPGFHVTGIYHNDPEMVHELLKLANTRILLKRLGTADDVTGLAAYLMEEEYMTGQAINIDGGAVFH